MIDFRAVGSVDRPLLDIYLDEERLVPQTCLIDSGAVAVRLSAELAEAAGVALPDAPTSGDVSIAGVRHQIYEIEHDLAVTIDGRDVRWRAPVTFCDPWPHPFGLLGLRGFLDRFDLDLRAAQRQFQLRRAD